MATIIVSAASAMGHDASSPDRCAHPQVLIAGGYGLTSDDGFVPLESAELYDPTTASFSPANTSMVEARAGHTATTLADGRILLAGGYGRDYVASNTAEIYDPATGKFTATGNLNDGRYGHTATLLRNGTVLIAGGSSSITGNALASAEIYDPKRGTFTLTANLNVARSAHSATLLGDGEVLIAGGADYDSNGPSLEFLDSAELYHPLTHHFSELRAKMAAPSSQQAAILMKNGRVLMVGGFDSNTCCPPGALNTAEIFYPRIKIFRATPKYMQENRSSPSITLLDDGKVLIAGGYPYEAELSDAEVYDPKAETFTLTKNVMSSERGGHTATLLPDGSVLLAGGEAQGTQAGQIRDEIPLASADLYDPATDSFAAVRSQLTTARFDHTANLVCSP
jgi:N-acetylneuraminic acid mutarotase